MAVQASPDSKSAHDSRAYVYGRRRKDELSLMSKGIYGAAAAESEAKAERGEG